jgi:putative endonuclease
VSGTTSPRRTALRATGVRTPRQRAGDAAEEAACAHLVRHGCRILDRNVRFREGELDVVAQDGADLVFVEVRLRSSAAFGGAGASVDRYKQRRLLRAAQHYLQQRYGDGRARRWPPCRFDVVTADAGGVTDWIRKAFGADE